MRDTLPKSGPFYNESGIVNLNTNSQPGSHWVSYKKKGHKVAYFDSYGNLKPPIELQEYFRGSQINYNHNSHQSYNSYNCGHLCLDFLYE